MKIENPIVMIHTRFKQQRLIVSQLLLLPMIVIMLAGVVCAQTNRDPTRAVEEAGPNLLDEMRVRWEIKYAEKERLENLDRAREASQLGSELYNSYTRNSAFTANEKKKLERLEKVTKKIRSRAGGSDGDVTISDVSNQMDSVLKRLAATTDEMKKEVEKTPRQIVSAAVIERSNEILELIRWIKSFSN
jgi:membrane-associated HD superfamily phosphohydrolase